MARSGLTSLVAFWRELKRRRVVRVVLAYGVVGFGALEVAGTLFPALLLPDWSVTVVAVLVIVGFPVSLVLAWAFEITPDGVRRAEPADKATPEGAGALPHGTRYMTAGLVLGIVVSAAAFGGYARLRSVEPAGGTAEGTPASSIAILPFRYTGDAAHAYLGEGIVDLFSTKLDGVGGLRTVDPNALFGVLAGTGEDRPLTPAEASRIAVQLGAAEYVLGSITEIGGRLQLRATQYGVDGGVSSRADIVAENEDDLLRAVDEAARQLVAGRLASSGGELVQLAALTSRSVPALRAYLEGERLLRRADGSGAAEAFERAIREDSMFALAYYELSVARDWGGAGSADEAAERALALRDRLPARQRELLDAYYSYRTGDHPAAEAAYTAILARTPTDVEAWYGLAEVLFHHGPLAGRLPSQAEDAFRRVLGFQPDHVPSIYHLTSIAVSNGDLAQLDSLTERIVTIGSPFTLDLRAQQAFAHADPDRMAMMIDELSRPENAAAANFGFLAMRTGNLEALRELAVELAGPDRPDAIRRRALRWVAIADLATGRIAAARTRLEESRSDDALALAQHAYQAALPFVPAEPAELHELRAELVGASQETVESLAFGGPLPGAAVRDLLIGLLSARLGDAQDALRRADGLDDLATPSELGSLHADLAAEIRVLNHYHQGRAEDALATAESMPLKPGLTEFAFVHWTGLAIARLLRAELLAEAGRLEEALRWYEVADEGSYAGVMIRGPAELGVATVHDRLGNAAAAARHYARFIELWKSADPELQPLVDSARLRLDRLHAEG